MEFIDIHATSDVYDQVFYTFYLIHNLLLLNHEKPDMKLYIYIFFYIEQLIKLWEKI